MNIKKNDQVIVLTGEDKKKKGKVLEVKASENKVIVEGVKIQSKHVKPRSAQQAGGIQKAEGAIDASNVMVICPDCGKPTKVAHDVTADGKKIRVCKKCSKSLDKIAGADKKDKKKSNKSKKD